MLRASAGLARGRLAHVHKSGHCARSLSGGGAARALAARARRAARVRNGPIALEGLRASVRAHSLSARQWCHAQALASRAAVLRMCARAATMLALYREEAQHARLPRPHAARARALRALAACARRATRVRIGPMALEGQFVSDRDNLLVQGPNATCRRWPRARPACACAQERRLCSLTVGRWRSTRACRARASRREGSKWPYSSRGPVR